MLKVYRVLAYAVAAAVAIQAGAIGYGVWAQLNWIENGNALDNAAFESGAPGTAALIFHSFFGGAVLLVAIALLVISFFAKIERGVRWAVIVLVTTFVQIALGVLSHFTAVIGALHGAVAMALFGVAMMAAMRVRRAAPVEEAVPASVV
jgi:heme A synthase